MDKVTLTDLSSAVCLKPAAQVTCHQPQLLPFHLHHFKEKNNVVFPSPVALVSLSVQQYEEGCFPFSHAASTVPAVPHLQAKAG